MHTHSMNVQRGADNQGATGLKCATCHGTENNPNSGVPGAAHWGLAPKSMGWVGLNMRELCRAIKDPNKNHPTSLERRHAMTCTIERVLTPGGFVVFRVSGRIGSTRPGRKGEAVGKWAYDIARKRTDAEFELVDIAEFNLPLPDEPMPPMFSQYSHDDTRVWSAKYFNDMLDQLIAWSGALRPLRKGV